MLMEPQEETDPRCSEETDPQCSAEMGTGHDMKNIQTPEQAPPKTLCLPDHDPPKEIYRSTLEESREPQDETGQRYPEDLAMELDKSSCVHEKELMEPEDETGQRYPEELVIGLSLAMQELMEAISTSDNNGVKPYTNCNSTPEKPCLPLPCSQKVNATSGYGSKALTKKINPASYYSRLNEGIAANF